MKKLVLVLLEVYQIIISPILRSVLGIQVICRYSPTCSEYMKQKVKKLGVIKGMALGIRQLSECHPWSKKYGTTI